jgi:hypothetical protein
MHALKFFHWLVVGVLGGIWVSLGDCDSLETASKQVEFQGDAILLTLVFPFPVRGSFFLKSGIMYVNKCSDPKG